MAGLTAGQVPWNSGNQRRFRSAAAILLLALVTVPHLSAESHSTTHPIHVGFSSSMLADVNENDARAAMKVWAQVLFKERGLPIDPEMMLLHGTEEISRALQRSSIDAVAITTDEYWEVRDQLWPGQIVAGVFNGQISEIYVLLVHRAGGIDHVRDLKGRSLALLLNPRMSLALAWLDALLTEASLGPASGFFGQVTRWNRLARVMLPVFFRQSDACIVTLRGFQTMSELNPQVGRQLKIIASSPELVPAGFFFRAGFSAAIRNSMLAQFDKIHLTPAGQQALTLFQSQKLEVCSIAVLNSAIELLAARR